jgi:hypothetical protein
MQNEQRRLESGQNVDCQSKIEWAFNDFSTFKSSGTDTVRTLLQNKVEYFASYLSYIFRACQAYGCIPRSWRQVKLTFIPQPRKPDHNE